MILRNVTEIELYSKEGNQELNSNINPQMNFTQATSYVEPKEDIKQQVVDEMNSKQAVLALETETKKQRRAKFSVTRERLERQERLEQTSREACSRKSLFQHECHSGDKRWISVAERSTRLERRARNKRQKIQQKLVIGDKAYIPL